MASYVILIDEAPDGGFGAWAPDLFGCVPSSIDEGGDGRSRLRAS